VSFNVTIVPAPAVDPDAQDHRPLELRNRRDSEQVTGR
jgi:hypothetical protein